MTFFVPEYVLTSIGLAACQISIYSASELTGTPQPLIFPSQISPKLDYESCEDPIDSTSRYPVLPRTLHHSLY